jgi:hypothetical protein
MTNTKRNKNIILFTVLSTFFITSALSSLLAMFVHNFYINNIFADVRAIFDGTIPWIEQRISAQFFVDEMRLASANVWCIVFAVAFAIAALPCIILLVKNILIDKKSGTEKCGTQFYERHRILLATLLTFFATFAVASLIFAIWHYDIMTMIVNDVDDILDSLPYYLHISEEKSNIGRLLHPMRKVASSVKEWAEFLSALAVIADISILLTIRYKKKKFKEKI